MLIIEATTLHYQDARSDKVYHAYIERDANALHSVVALYGRRGQSLKETRKGDGLTLALAYAKYNSLVQEKTGKQYVPVSPDAVGIPANVRVKSATSGSQPDPAPAPTPTPAANNDTGLRPQLLNPVTEEDATSYIAGAAFGLQEKKNGVRLMVRKDGLTVIAANRSGNKVPLSPELEAAYIALGGSFVLDGELVDGTHYVFDLLEDFGRDLRERPFRDRFDALSKLLVGSRESVQLVPLYTSAQEKQDAFDGFRDGKREGVVFKRLDAAAVAGRPASGGDQIKVKFWCSASAIVAEHNEKKSVRLEMFDRGDAPAVSCHCGDNHDATAMASCDGWLCRCGNTPHRYGFHYVDTFGQEAESGALLRCDGCAALLDRSGHELKRASVGNVTVKQNQSTPALGAIVEVKYLHIVSAGGHLIQPELLCERDDISASECTTAQLKIEAAA